MFALFIRLLVVAAIYLGTGTWFYRGRVLGKMEIFRSDAVVFILPSIVAFLCYAFVFWSYGFAQKPSGLRLTFTVICSVLAAAMSFGVLMAIVLNLYGS